jgi:hypothetical protein
MPVVIAAPITTEPAVWVLPIAIVLAPVPPILIGLAAAAPVPILTVVAPVPVPSASIFAALEDPRVIVPVPAVPPIVIVPVVTEGAIVYVEVAAPSREKFPVPTSIVIPEAPVELPILVDADPAVFIVVVPSISFGPVVAVIDVNIPVAAVTDVHVESP